ncbi:hypothetical protein AB0H86_41355 [Streptomyces sp. NPDC050997]|uniref:hypothetical protein n=1 Tax=Streptomyces sp. NPDC050997 TaxID=3155519 RepID=UPI0034373DD3
MTAAPGRPNPYHVLGLPVDADQQTVVEHGEDGIKTGSDEERDLYDWAMRELIGHPHTRLRHALTEPPRTDYRDARWRRFARPYRTAPVDLGAPGLVPDDFDVAEIVRQVVRELLRPLPDGAHAVLEDPSPAADDPEPELEVHDVLFG